MTLELLQRIVCAAMLGGLIGLEREYRAKEAGFRTHFLVGLGAALFMILSKYGYDDVVKTELVRLDPSRIAAQVVSGIGFIGAGCIIFQRNVVRGLTTAAGLWVTSAIGMACGTGMYAVAATTTVLVVVCLEVVNFIHSRFGIKRRKNKKNEDIEMENTFEKGAKQLVIAMLMLFCCNWAVADDRNKFVAISDVVPDAILEIRYFGTYNFVGTRIDGYEQPTALLTKEAAEALKAVSDDVKSKGYRLKIYDAYRPQKAVDNFVRWAEDIPDTLMKTYFYPDLDKSVLFEQDYIAEKSGHTRGSTVDLTLFDMTTEKELDMGGTFDFFGPESHPDFCGNPDTDTYTGGTSPAGRTITAEQFHNRMILRQAMLRHGFKPIYSEWWHFTLKDEPYPTTYFTFPVRQEECCKCKCAEQ